MLWQSFFFFFSHWNHFGLHLEIKVSPWSKQLLSVNLELTEPEKNEQKSETIKKTKFVYTTPTWTLHLSH